MKKLISFFFHFGNISTNSESPGIKFSKTGLNYSYILAIRIQKSIKHPILLMIFLLRKQFFEKIITEGGSEIDCFEPVLEFFTQGLAPGIPKT